MGIRQILIPLFLFASQMGVGAGKAEPLAQIQNFEALHGSRSTVTSLIRLYFIPTAPVKLDWTSPRQLLFTTLKASIRNKSHPIGHVAIEVQFRGQDDPEHHISTGASALQSRASRQLLIEDDVAFSILERAWPGVLEGDDDLAESIVNRSRSKNRLAVATFLISDAACLRLLEYHRALRADTRSRWYGFAARPRRGEGSGCSAFGASFLEQIGVLTPPLRAAWSQSVRVPLSVMAGYMGHARISLVKAVTSRASAAWAKPTDPHMLLEFFDPDLMFTWAIQRHDDPGEAHGLLIQRDPDLPRLLDQRYHMDGLAERNVKAIVIDARDVPTPNDPIFTGEPAITEKPDTTIKTVVRTDKVVSPNGSFEIHP